MSLTQKLNYVAKWTPYEATKCWDTYHNKFMDKYGGALHQAMMQGSVEAYINKELRTFERYARMWAYRRNLTPRVETTFTPPPLDLHHVAQHNKQIRYQHGCGQ